MADETQPRKRVRGEPGGHSDNRKFSADHKASSTVDIETGSVTANSSSSASVEGDEAKSLLYSRDSKKKVSAAFSLLSVIILTGLILLFVKYMDGRLPRPLTTHDLKDQPMSFIEERAWKDLHGLTGLGVRVTGYQTNDVLCKDALLNILGEINSTSNDIYRVQFEEQRPSGAFWTDDDEGFTSSYARIVNVVAKLEPSDPQFRRNGSILLNCHFDTKPGSPGATDNMISCTVMLEILRVLSNQTSLVVNNTILFLFNGAEELGLQGAHGFVRGITNTFQSQDPDQQQKGHPWSGNLKAFINLEGAGGGGREILFQTTGASSEQTGWLLKAYKAAPHPYGTVIGEEAFQFGLIPSDTDFRIFRDFSDTPGLDMAFVKNGWVYHTKWDKLSEVPPGSIQHMGNNALAIVEHLGNLDFDKEKDSSGEMIFFDVLGAFMITYSKAAGIAIHVIVALVTLGLIGFEVGFKGELRVALTYLRYFVSTLVAWGLAIGSAALVAVILNGAGYPKPFYSYPSLSTVLFGIPAMLTQTIVFSLCLKSSPRESWLASRFTLAIVLLLSTFFTRGAYVFAIPLIFGVVGWFGARILMRGWPRAIMMTYLIIGEVIPMILSSYFIISLIDIFVPIVGRSGSETNANLFLGLIVSALITILFYSGLASLFVDYDKSVLITCLVASILILNPMLVFGFVGKVPYQEKTPMRLTICEVDRSWYNAVGTEVNYQSGYWFWPIDSNTKDFFPTFLKTVEEIHEIQDFNIDYENCEDLYCAQPFIWPTTSAIKTTHWLPQNLTRLPQPLRSQVYMNVLQNVEIDSNRRRIILEFYGPPQITVVLSPRLHWDALINIDPSGVNETVLREGEIRWKGRNVYYIYHGRGYDPQPQAFTLSLELLKIGSSAEEPTGDAILNVQLTGLFLHEPLTSPFTDFIGRFPSWVYTMNWNSVMKMYSLDGQSSF